MSSEGEGAPSTDGAPTAIGTRAASKRPRPAPRASFRDSRADEPLRRLAWIESRLDSLESDLETVRGGARLAPLRPVPTSWVDRLRQIAPWRLCVGLGALLLAAEVFTAIW